MRKIFYSSMIFLVVISSQNLNAQSKKFGLGIIVGEPTGLSAKLWLSNTNALAFGLGWSVGGYDFDGSNPDFNRVTRSHLHIDYLWHSFNALSPSGQFPVFYGIGGRIISGPEYNGTFAVRGVFGIEWIPRNTPLDVFIEIVPILTLVNSTGFGIDAGFGARIFF